MFWICIYIYSVCVNELMYVLDCIKMAKKKYNYNMYFLAINKCIEQFDFNEEKNIFLRLK